MASYSTGLRNRIVDAVERDDHTKSEIAEMFIVHESIIISSFVSAGIGMILLLSLTVVAVAKLDSHYLTVLSTLVARMPDTTLEEFRKQLK